jgi:hypothetical protein
LARPTLIRAQRLTPALLALVLLSGCGGEGETVTTVRPPLTPNFQQEKAIPGVDPDQNPEAGSDVSSSVRPLGQGRYRLLVQNGSDVGFVNSFVWTPPAGVTVRSVTASSTGSCELSGRVISCRATLRPPKCTCRPGGQMTIDFSADAPTGRKATNYGLAGGFVRIRDLTPVPYLIPSSVEQRTSPYADLPVCAAGSESTKDAPCVHSGQATP